MDLEKRLENKIKELEDSRRNILVSLTGRNRDLRKQLEGAKKGAEQIRDSLNSILIAAALDKGDLRVPKTHMELLTKYNFHVESDGDYYIFKVEEKKE